MGLCVKCNKLIEPNLMFIIDKVDGKDIQMCVFCKVDKDKVTVQEDGKDIIYTQEQAIKNYEAFLKVLSAKPNVKKSFAKEGAERLIKVVR